jgi:hypothetical protein
MADSCNGFFQPDDFSTTMLLLLAGFVVGHSTPKFTSKFVIFLWRNFFSKFAIFFSSRLYTGVVPSTTPTGTNTTDTNMLLAIIRLSSALLYNCSEEAQYMV